LGAPNYDGGRTLPVRDPKHFLTFVYYTARFIELVFLDLETKDWNIRRLAKVSEDICWRIWLFREREISTFEKTIWISDGRLLRDYRGWDMTKAKRAP
jgi:hypothetical protein